MSNLTDNTAALNLLLEKANSLPEAGGGGVDADETEAAILADTKKDYYNDKVTALRAYAFYKSTVETVCFPSLQSVSTGPFDECRNLKKADMGQLSSFSSYTFRNTSSLETLIFRITSKVCNCFSSSALTGSGIAEGTGYVYVPAALVDSYKTASNWSVYASQIRAIEDYPDITGG